jgi:hypothetical protein
MNLYLIAQLISINMVNFSNAAKRPATSMMEVGPGCAIEAK